MYSHLGSSTSRLGATTFIQKPKRNTRKDPLTDKGVRLDLLGLYDTGLGRSNGSRETVQVTCTLEVPRWSASSLRHSPPDCAAEMVLRTQPSRLGAQREGTRSSNHRGAATIPRRNHHTTKTKLQLETTSFHEATKRR